MPEQIQNQKQIPHPGSDQSFRLTGRLLSALPPQTPSPLFPGGEGGEEGAGGSGNLFQARFCRAGTIRAVGNRPTKFTIKPEALQTALADGLFNARAVFLDHSSFLDFPSLRDLVAVTEGARWNEETQSVDGTLRFYDTPDAGVIRNLLAQILTDENPPDVGLSLVFFPLFAGEAVNRIKYVESVDLVFQPAADGRVLKALSALNFHSLQKENPMSDHIQDNLLEIKARQSADPPAQPLAESPTLSGVEASAQGRGGVQEKVAPWLDAIASTASAALISASTLPQVSKDRLSARNFTSPGEVAAAIEEERAYLAALTENQVILSHGAAPRSPYIQLGLTGFDQFQLAFEAMLDGVRPKDGIRPLSGLREFYNLVSGDYELTGLFQPERVQFANVNSSTMSALVANALNKRIVNAFAQYPKWWEPVVQEEDFNNLQQIKWITLAGIGSLPTVSEGAPYTELAWDDKNETADFVKKGGYLGITLEAIDKDDTRKLRSAPQALAQGAYLTLSKSLSSLFVDNAGVGPTMSDSKALFHADHGNLGASPLSSETWAATRQAMRDQTEFGASGALTEAMGALTAPKFCLVPNELEHTALQVLGANSSASAGGYLDNVWAEGDTLTERIRSARARIIVVDLWTDPNNWAAVADPLLYPTIGIGYRYGRVPEIFSVAAPNSGLMFTNDVMPVKVRFFYAVGPMDWRGLYKHNVA